MGLLLCGSGHRVVAGVPAAFSRARWAAGGLAVVGPSAWQAGLVATLPEVGVAAAVAAGIANWLRLRREPELAAARAALMSGRARDGLRGPGRSDDGDDGHRIFVDPWADEGETRPGAAASRAGPVRTALISALLRRMARQTGAAAAARRWPHDPARLVALVPWAREPTSGTHRRLCRPVLRGGGGGGGRRPFRHRGPVTERSGVGIPTFVQRRADYPTWTAWDRALAGCCASFDPDPGGIGGFMKLVGAGVPRPVRGPVHQHPSVLLLYAVLRCTASEMRWSTG